MGTSTVLQGIVAEHVAAVNAFDEDAIVATFADDAFVNDAHREFWGTDAIRRWVAKETVGDTVTIHVTEVIDHYDRRSCVAATTAYSIRPTFLTS